MEGGKAVVLTCNKPNLCPQTNESFLFLITSEAYELYNPVAKTFIEIPISEVSRIDYKSLADHALPE